MPSNWTHHADGVGTAVQTRHDLDGRLKSVRIQLDAFKVRTWTEEEVEDENTKTPKHVHYDEPTGLYEEHGGGANATMKFSVTGGEASLSYIEPENGDVVEPKHMKLLRGAERVLASLTDVETVGPTIEAMVEPYDEADPIHMDAIDA